MPCLLFCYLFAEHSHTGSEIMGVAFAFHSITFQEPLLSFYLFAILSALNHIDENDHVDKVHQSIYNEE